MRSEVEGFGSFVGCRPSVYHFKRLKISLFAITPDTGPHILHSTPMPGTQCSLAVHRHPWHLGRGMNNEAFLGIPSAFEPRR